MKISLESMEGKPTEYRQALMGAGTVEGNWLRIKRDALREILKVHAPERLKEIGMGVGDAMERIVKPIAMALKSPCVDASTRRLKPESPCDKRRKKMNAAADGLMPQKPFAP